MSNGSGGDCRRCWQQRVGGPLDSERTSVILHVLVYFRPGPLSTQWEQTTPSQQHQPCQPSERVHWWATPSRTASTATDQYASTAAGLSNVLSETGSVVWLSQPSPTAAPAWPGHWKFPRTVSERLELFLICQC